jgi:Kef-type K+ transport system membrane component KefB
VTPLVHVLMTLAAVVVFGWILGHAFRYLGQPAVIGEVVAGIALGPSVLGHVWPDAAEFLLPTSAAPYLHIIAQIGVIFYMFLIGLELNLDALKGQATTVVAISYSGIVIPFLLGIPLAFFLHPRLSSSAVPLTSFTLFIGVALAITAFPVLARILTDQKMQATPLGILALACAALGDATAWCLLAFVVGITQAAVGSAFLVIGLTVAFIAAMILIVRPRRRAARRR